MQGCIKDTVFFHIGRKSFYNRLNVGSTPSGEGMKRYDAEDPMRILGKNLRFCHFPPVVFHLPVINKADLLIGHEMGATKLL